MSQENVEAVHRGLDAFNRRDVQSWLGHFDPAVEVSEDRSIPDAGTYRGHQGLVKWMYVMDRNWDGLQVQAERITESGDDVLLLATTHARGKESGVDVEGRFGSVFTVRDGRVVAWRIYAGWSEIEELMAGAATERRPAS